MCSRRYSRETEICSYIDKAGDPLENVYGGRPIEENPTSPNTMARVTNWVQQCNEHPTCTTDLPLLPARAIDVGDEANGYRLKLREMEGESGK